MNKRTVSAGIVAGLTLGGGALALAHAGGASAGTSHAAAVFAEPTTDTTVPGSTASTVPASPGIPGRRGPGMPTSGWEKAAIDKLVKDGTLTQAQADAVTKALDAARPTGGFGGGPGGRGALGGQGLAIAAKTIGITVDQLRTAIQSGQTVAQVATSKGVTAQAVIDALVADLKTHEAAEVTAGNETQAQSDAEITAVTARITGFVNTTQAAPVFGGPGMGGPMGDHRGPGRGNRNAPGGPATSQAPTTTVA
jgi:hypothetical protein